MLSSSIPVSTLSHSPYEFTRRCQGSSGKEAKGSISTPYWTPLHTTGAEIRVRDAKRHAPGFTQPSSPLRVSVTPAQRVVHTMTNHSVSIRAIRGHSLLCVTDESVANAMNSQNVLRVGCLLLDLGSKAGHKTVE